MSTTLVRTPIAAAIALAAAGCWDLEGVKLQDADGGDTDADTDSDTDADTDGPAQILSITADPPCAGAGDTITFTAETTGNVTGWSWSFGDSVTSEDESPNHFYADLGVYDVSLSVTGPEGNDELAVPEMIRIIEPGWSRLNPAHLWGDVAEIWSNPGSADTAWAATDRAILQWDEWDSEWNEVDDVPVLDRFEGVAGTGNGGGYFVTWGLDEEGLPRFLYYDGTEAFDADPDDQLPHGSSDNYIGAFMPGWSSAVLALQPNLGTQVELWLYDATEDPYPWTEITSASVLPNWANAFAVGGTTWGPYRMYLSQSGQIYVSDIWDGEATSVAWYPSDSPYCGAILAVGTEELWCGGADGTLQRAVIDGGTPVLVWEDVGATAGLWTDDYAFVDLALTWDYEEIYATAVDDSVTPAETIIVHVSEISDTPTFELLDTSALLTSPYDSQIAAFDPESVWFGAANAYIARWDGEAWSNPNGTLTTGSLGLPVATADGHLYVVAGGGNPQQLLDHDGADWVASEIPGSWRPAVVWPAAPDQIWAFGNMGLAYHYNGVNWETADAGLDPDATVYAAWGSSPDDIWIAGSNSGGAPLVMHYNGSGWTVDGDAEAILGGRIYGISGSAADNVWAVSRHGILAHFDGTAWAQVAQTLFDAPDLFGQCTDVAIDDCAGDGWGFAAMHVAAVEGGAFAALIEGTYELLGPDEANCPEPGQGRCVLDADGEEFMATLPIHYDGTSWSALEVPDSVFTIDPMASIVFGLWAASPDEAYATAYAVDAEENLEAIVIGYDGASWSALPEQPASFEELPFAMTGARPGEVFGLGFEGEVLMRYQGCGE